MVAKIIVLLILLFLLTVFFHNRILYNSIRTGNVGPVLYIAKNGGLFSNRLYRFRYKYSKGSWYAYIEKMPPALATNYTYTTPFIFFIQPIKSFDEIKRKSFSWADKMQLELATNGRS